MSQCIYLAGATILCRGGLMMRSMTPYSSAASALKYLFLLKSNWIYKASAHVNGV